ncbi:MAG TPA: CheR family methyltransferase [Candidatus Polarisedimenticolia bacterium]|nr:CheR family methyltransferase [Candidatus Polarisedimenticolia bacterium]
MLRPVDAGPLEELEVRLLVEGVNRRYGYDFSGFHLGPLVRAARRARRREGLPTVSALLERLLRDAACMDRLLVDLARRRTPLFHEPELFLAIREEVIPILRTYPRPRIWVAGGGSGHDLHAMAIVLQEEGLLERCRLYATDLSDSAVRAAREGTVRAAELPRASEAYRRTGGRGSLEAYLRIDGGRAAFDPGLGEKVVFASHFVVTDAVFNEFNLILCRNLLRTLTGPLQRRVADLLHRSLDLLGFLCLGGGESIELSPHERCYEAASPPARLFRRVR